MTDLQLELTKLIGSKKLSFGCYLQKNNHWRNSDEPVIGRITSDSTGYDDGYQMGFNAPYMGTYSTTILGISVLNEVDENGRKKWEIIGHPATLSDLHRWINAVKDTAKNNKLSFRQNSIVIAIWIKRETYPIEISYNASLDLLDQSEEVLIKIIDFIKANQ